MPPEKRESEQREMATTGSIAGQIGQRAGSGETAATTDAPAVDAALEPVPDRSIGLPVTGRAVRIAEALLFASDRPVTPERLAAALDPGADPRAVLAALRDAYAGHGVEVAEVAGGWAFRTATDLAPALTRVIEVPRRLPRAAMEALAVIAWRQPVTRAEIEDARGVSLSQASLDVLLEAGLIAPRGRREAPGRPTLWVTTPRFLEQFGLRSLAELPQPGDLFSSLDSPPGRAGDAAPMVEGT